MSSLSPSYVTNSISGLCRNCCPGAFFLCMSNWTQWDDGFFLFYNINVCDPVYPNIIHCQLSVTIAVDSADHQNVLFCYLSPVPRIKGARWIWWQTHAWSGMCTHGQANPAMPFSKELTLMWLWLMQNIQIKLSATWEILTGYPWDRNQFHSYGVQIWPHAWCVRSYT